MLKKFLFFISFSSISLAMDGGWQASDLAKGEAALKAASVNPFVNIDQNDHNQNTNLISSINNNKIPCAILIFVCYVLYELKRKKEAKEKEEQIDDKPNSRIRTRKAIS